MKTELLAPAGDLESAYSAFYFGADAVYLGLKQFSARAEATNFSPEELDEITAYAHANGKKVYVTVNTVVQESELPSVLETLSICDQYNVDAIIIQDWGIARLVRTKFPRLALHASTQMAIHNLSGALAMKRLGFSRVVLARELSLPEILEIRDKSGLEVEVFIHGALCYSYSGLCLFSSLTTGRSANRGKCVYSCRDIFRHNDTQDHPFSMKDLALEKDVLKLTGLSLKIEGRKKTPLYVGAVVDYYRRILDTGRVDKGLTDNLKQIFARPWTKLHFAGRNKEVTDPDFVGHRGLPLGTVAKVFNHTLTFRPNHSIARYDGIQIDVAGQEKPFGFSAENLTVSGHKVFEVPAGQTVTLTLPPHHPFIKSGDAVYLASSTRVKGAYRYTKPRPNAYRNRTQIDVDVFVEVDKIMACTDTETTTLSGTFSPAQHPEQVTSAVKKAFDKTGDTNFCLGQLRLHNPLKLFIPVSALNELRRALYSQIKLSTPPPTLPTTPSLRADKVHPHWLIRTDDKKLAATLSGYDELIYVLSPTDTPENLGLMPNKLRLALPTILRPEKPWHKTISAFVSAGFKRWEVGNPAGLTLLPSHLDISLDNTVSMLNTQAIEQALELGFSHITFSPEDTSDNIRTLASATTQTALVLYQDPPLFLSANCVRPNTCQACSHTRFEETLSNGKAQYTLISENCQTVVINTQPLVLPATAKSIPVGAYRLDFCHRRYTSDEVTAIITAYRSGQKLPRGTTGNFEKQFAK